MLELLISKGAVINAKDIIYLSLIILFLIKIIWKKSRKLNKKNKTPLSYFNYSSDKMLKIIEINEENLRNSSNTFQCDDEIYRILLKTGKYINAKDIIYLNIIILFLFKSI